MSSFYHPRRYPLALQHHQPHWPSTHQLHPSINIPADSSHYLSSHRRCLWARGLSKCAALILCVVASHSETTPAGDRVPYAWITMYIAGPATRDGLPKLAAIVLSSGGAMGLACAGSSGSGGGSTDSSQMIQQALGILSLLLNVLAVSVRTNAFQPTFSCQTNIDQLQALVIYFAALLCLANQVHILQHRSQAIRSRRSPAWSFATLEYNSANCGSVLYRCGMDILHPLDRFHGAFSRCETWQRRHEGSFQDSDVCNHSDLVQRSRSDINRLRYADLL